MIPDKLYIPTATLNFNNIMSSESISPAGFYSVRSFGYKRFEKVEPNNLNNRIILYDKYPDFQISDNEIENYPLVIELNAKYLAKEVNDIIQEHKNGVYYSDETIYFNPFSTKLYFANEREIISTLSKAEPSIETKMVSLYRDCFCVKPANIDLFDLQICDLQDSEADFSKHISKDRKINKLKGFLYAYLLGANKTLSSEIVNLKKYTKDLRNVLSAVLVSKDNYASYQQQNQIEKLTTAINDAFYKAEGLSKKILAIIEDKKEQYKCENFIDIIKSEGLYDMWFQKLNIRPSFQLSQFYVTQSASPDKKQEIFNSYFENLERAISKFASQKNTKTESLPTLQNWRIESKSEQNKLLLELLSEYLEEAYNSNDFLSSRYEFAKSGGGIFKREFGDRWIGSEFQTYINTLLKNLNEGSAFSLNSTKDLTFKSFAAFCQKGEDDIDKLKDYLISNDIGDFRIAFALWGIVFGFANMPKTLTNEFFSSNDLYVSEVYKYIFKQIHGIELEGKIERKRDEKPVQQETTEIINPSKMNKLQETKSSDDIQSASEEWKFRQNLRAQTIKQENEIIEIWKGNDFLVNDKLFNSISAIKGCGKNSKKLEKIKECFSFNNHTPKSISRQMFLSESSGKFLDDFVFLSNNQDFIKLVSWNKDWEKDLKWFISEYNNPQSKYYGSGNEKGASAKDNETVIRKFRYLKNETYKDTEQFLKSLYLQNEQ